MAFVHVRFGDYLLDPAARELRLDGEIVSLPPKSFDCLAYLVEHRERAVGRDELISAVWARTDVSDDVVAQTLLRARRAVGDTGNEQHAIRTVPRFGYRWILPVETIETPIETAATGPASAPASAPPPRPRRLPRVAIGAAVLLLAAIVAFAIFSTRRRATQAVATKAADDGLIMVLPVEVRGGGNEAAWIRLGAMDYVASRLRESARHKVLPSEQTLLLYGRDGAQADAGTLHRLEVASGARTILVPHASFSGGDWDFVLDVYHGAGVKSYEARAGNPLDAAALTVARFDRDAGVEPGDVAAAVASDPKATELVQRMDAAMLAGDLAEAHRLVDDAPPALRDDPAVKVRAGQIAFRAGQLDAAEQLFTPLARDETLAPALRSQAEMGLGAVAVRRNDFDTADRRYTAAIETLSGAPGRDHPDLLGTAFTGRGVANGARRRFDAALADFARARVELERAGDHGGMASVEVNRALVEASRGRYGEAVAAFDRAISTFSRFDVRDNLAAALLGKANAELALLDRDGALAASARAADLADHLENPLLKRRIASARIRALLASGDLDEAAKRLDLAGRDDPEFALLRARLALERDDVAGARRIAEALLDAPGDADRLPLEDLTLVALDIARRSGDPALLERALAKLAATSVDAGDPDRALALELGAAEKAALAGDDAGARKHFLAAFDDADRRGSPDSLVTAGVAYARYLISRHALDAAMSVVGRLAPYAERDYRAARATADLYAALGNADLAASARRHAAALAGQRKLDAAD